ncbi:hypothetical protein F2Q68_00031399 [Brassica cretica]|uniref:Uncharacterized protein n=1 Tax=Brassica cretica TaxID=69181 RepID=A0A8S9GET6_BRACR|nr:hypothetical protein F2Q68_00031399 [Brassica cretica]
MKTLPREISPRPTDDHRLVKRSGIGPDRFEGRIRVPKTTRQQEWRPKNPPNVSPTNSKDNRDVRVNVPSAVSRDNQRALSVDQERADSQRTASEQPGRMRGPMGLIGVDIL